MPSAPTAAPLPDATLGHRPTLMDLEPALLRGALLALLQLATSAGLAINESTQAAIVAGVMAVFTVVVALWTRQGVYSPATASALQYTPPPLDDLDGHPAEDDAVASALAAMDEPGPVARAQGVREDGELAT